MALFVLASKDGWVNIMYNGLDAVGVDLQVFVVGLCLWSLWCFLSFFLFRLFASSVDYSLVFLYFFKRCSSCFVNN